MSDCETEDEFNTSYDYMESKLEMIIDKCESIGIKTTDIYDSCLALDLDIEHAILLFYWLFDNIDVCRKETYILNDLGELEYFGNDSHVGFNWRSWNQRYDKHLSPKPIYNARSGISTMIETMYSKKIVSDKMLEITKFYIDTGCLKWTSSSL